MNIRQATPSDAGSIRSLLIQLGYPQIDEQETIKKIKDHQEPGYRILVAESAGLVIGFIALHWFNLLHHKSKLGRITSFCVHENFRSQGIGKQLLLASEEMLANEGCGRFEVTSNEIRQQTHQFYLRHGYVEQRKRFIKQNNLFQ